MILLVHQRQTAQLKTKNYKVCVSDLAMSSRRRRYPKRSEIEGPPPNYGGKEEDSEESEDEESLESLDVDSDSEDTDMEEVVMTIKDCRPCKVDLPNLRVERGKSEDVEVPREVMLQPCQGCL